MKLPRSFYEQSTVDVAKQLLGKLLVHRRDEDILSGRIVETEAYVGPEDLACHASKGRTHRTDVMFGAAGHAYVYFIYGFYNMLNLVTEAKDFPAAVLIRAVEPVRGIGRMKQNRKTDLLRNLASGPGKLCQAFAIDRSLNGADICGKVLYLEDRGEPTPKFTATPGSASTTPVSGKTSHYDLSFVTANLSRNVKPTQLGRTLDEDVRNPSGHQYRTASGDRPGRVRKLGAAA